jgi:hypothetical protein
MTTTYKAWVIDLKYKDDPRALAGRYFWGWSYGNPPPHLEGHRIAAFNTRKIAREHLKRMSQGKVVRATVTIETEGE